MRDRKRRRNEGWDSCFMFRGNLECTGLKKKILIIHGLLQQKLLQVRNGLRPNEESGCKTLH